MDDNTKIGEAGRILMSVIVRFSGLVLLFAGLWIAFQVLTEALNLYNEPQRIERFAAAIEKGSNIDKSLVSIQHSKANQARDYGLSEYPDTPGKNGEKAKDDISISYFLAWIIVLLLMLMIARISLSAIKTGGELVLYDVQIKQFARMLLKEVNKQDQ